MLHLVCVEPEIPQNVGTLLRTSVCLGFRLHLVHPLGFLLSDKFFKRAALDYGDANTMVHHESWPHFLCFAKETMKKGRRLLALDPLGSSSLYQFSFQEEDMILVGAEQNGLKDQHKKHADALLKIPMQPGQRSLNMAISGSLAIAEAQRQLGF